MMPEKYNKSQFLFPFSTISSSVIDFMEQQVYLTAEEKFLLMTNVKSRNVEA